MVCQGEEEKSKTLKLQGTGLIQRLILPTNECWICQIKFDNACDQIKHFSENHECGNCRGFVDDFEAKEKHICDWKLKPNTYLMKELEKLSKDISNDHSLGSSETTNSSEDSGTQEYEQLPRSSEISSFTNVLEEDTGTPKTDSQKGKGRNVLSSAMKNIKRKLK